jgi:hypothetical protein
MHGEISRAETTDRSTNVPDDDNDDDGGTEDDGNAFPREMQIVQLERKIECHHEL